MKNKKSTIKGLLKKELSNISIKVSLRSIISAGVISIMILSTGLYKVTPAYAMKRNGNLIESISEASENDSTLTQDGLIYNILTQPNKKIAGTVSLVAASRSLTGDVVIPKTITIGSDCYKVVQLDDEAFNGCENINSITIPDSVTNIGKQAFFNCIKMTSITIPESVTNLDSYMFFRCTNLHEINVSPQNANYCSVNGVLFNKDQTKLILYPAKKSDTDYNIPYSVNKISDIAFYACTNLNTVAISESVESIGEGAFSECTNLTTVTIPESVKFIGKGAFSECKKLTSIEIPSSVTRINANTFSLCTNLLSVTIPGSITAIDNCAFSNCCKITSITIPASVTSIHDEAFDGCQDLSEINVSPNNQKYSSIDGILFNKDKTLIIKYPLNKTNKSYIIPNSVTKINSGAFLGCKNLTSITIPNSVQIIDSFAFSSCENLTSLIIPNSVQTIETFAFSNCNGLTSLDIPKSVLKIGEAAFTCCKNLMFIKIPASINWVAYEAFGLCYSLRTITIKNNINSTELKKLAEQAEKEAKQNPTVENWFKVEKIYKKLCYNQQVYSQLIESLYWACNSKQINIEGKLEYSFNDVFNKAVNALKEILNKDLDLNIQTRSIALLYEIDKNNANKEFIEFFEKLDSENANKLIEYWKLQAEKLIKEGSNKNKCNNISNIFEMLSNFYKSKDPASAQVEIFKKLSKDIKNYQYLNHRTNYILHNITSKKAEQLENLNELYTVSQEAQNKINAKDFIPISDGKQNRKNKKEFPATCALCMGEFYKDQEHPVHLKNCTCNSGVAHKSCMLEFLNQSNIACPCCGVKYK